MRYEVEIHAQVTDTHVYTIQIDADSVEQAYEDGQRAIIDGDAGEPRTRDGNYTRDDMDNVSAAVVSTAGQDEDDGEEDDEDDGA